MLVSLQRIHKRPRTSPVFKAVLIALLGLQLPLNAQPSEDFYRDTWVAKSPEKGSLVLLLKQNGRAAYFWADNADRSVYQGSWSHEEGTATLTWEDGSTHQISEEDKRFKLYYSGGGQGEAYASPVQKLPGEILGQWARPPEKEEEDLSDRDRAKGFFGVWKISQETATHYVFIQPDRSAASTHKIKGQADHGLRGSWAKQGDDLHIAWNTGHYSILQQNLRSYGYKTIEPGQIIEADSQQFSPSQRTEESAVPADWLAHYEEERTAPRLGVAFSSRKDALQFYRGEWIVRHREDAYEKIKVGRYGGLSTSRSPDITGSWLLSGQDVFMRWNEGIRRILSPIADGFLLYEYKPGRPLDGVPTRIHPTAPADPKKLTTHLKNRDNAAQNILLQARAAGIEADKTSGFGSRFSRWVWPFGKEDRTSDSTALLIENTTDEQPELDNPWWWPLWSEKTPPSDSTEATTAEVTKVTEIAEVTPEKAPAERTPEPRNAQPKKWYWPF